MWQERPGDLQRGWAGGWGWGLSLCETGKAREMYGDVA